MQSLKGMPHGVGLLEHSHKGVLSTTNAFSYSNLVRKILLTFSKDFLWDPSVVIWVSYFLHLLKNMLTLTGI